VTLVELLEQRILDADDLERLDRHGVKLEPRPHRYEGLDPKDLVTSPVPVIDPAALPQTAPFLRTSAPEARRTPPPA
jgi:hypothetical protein